MLHYEFRDIRTLLGRYHQCYSPLIKIRIGIQVSFDVNPDGIEPLAQFHQNFLSYRGGNMSILGVSI